MAKTRDPSRTVLLRRKFEIQLRKRLKSISKAARKLIVTDDEFGLTERTPFQVMQQRFAFSTDSQKVAAFRVWLQQQIDDKLLTVDNAGMPWTNEFVESSYKKGLGRAYTDVGGAAAAGVPGFLDTKENFLRSAFFAPETLDKVQLLSTRTFEELKGIGAATAQQLNRIFAGGIADGLGAEAIARQIDNSIVTIERTRARVLARTEVIRAHAEGQLDGFGKLGIEEVEGEVEWLTAGDERVCPDCVALSGQIFTIEEARGLIPLHPQCRCAWKPVISKALRSMAA